MPHPDARLRARARELFSCTLETPGGLKVQTIHALCTRLLQQFPFEANVPARFTVLDDRDQFEIMERSILAVLLDAAAKPQSDIGKALATAITSSADRTFRDVVQDACLGNTGFLEWIGGNAGQALAQLHTTLGLQGDEQLADVEREIVDGPHLPTTAVAGGRSRAGRRQRRTTRNRRRRCARRYALAGTAQVEEYLCRCS